MLESLQEGLDVIITAEFGEQTLGFSAAVQKMDGGSGMRFFSWRSSWVAIGRLWASSWVIACCWRLVSSRSCNMGSIQVALVGFLLIGSMLWFGVGYSILHHYGNSRLWQEEHRQTLRR